MRRDRSPFARPLAVVFGLAVSQISVAGKAPRYPLAKPR